jgi:hypothetical protein
VSHFTGALFDQGAAIAGQLSDVADLPCRDEAGADQTVLGQLADPLAITYSGPAARHIAHVASVEKPAGELTFEYVEDGPPIDPVTSMPTLVTPSASSQSRRPSRSSVKVAKLAVLVSRSP